VYILSGLGLETSNLLAFPWPREDHWLWPWPQRLLALDASSTQQNTISSHSRSPKVVDFEANNERTYRAYDF